MKPVTFIVGALATLATAAPTKEVVEKRGGGFNGINNFNFVDDNFAYLASIGGLDFQLLAQLGSVNQFDVLGQFGGLFNANVFDIQNILAFQQLQTLLQFAQLGVFNQFDLSSLAFSGLNLGLIGGINSFDINSLISSSLVPQIQGVISQTNCKSYIPHFLPLLASASLPCAETNTRHTLFTLVKLAWMLVLWWAPRLSLVQKALSLPRMRRPKTALLPYLKSIKQREHPQPAARSATHSLHQSNHSEQRANTIALQSFSRSKSTSSNKRQAPRPPRRPTCF